MFIITIYYTSDAYESLEIKDYHYTWENNQEIIVCTLMNDEKAVFSAETKHQIVEDITLKNCFIKLKGDIKMENTINFDHLISELYGICQKEYNHIKLVAKDYIRYFEIVNVLESSNVEIPFVYKYLNNG